MSSTTRYPSIFWIVTIFWFHSYTLRNFLKEITNNSQEVCQPTSPSNNSFLQDSNNNPLPLTQDFPSQNQTLSKNLFLPVHCIRVNTLYLFTQQIKWCGEVVKWHFFLLGDSENHFYYYWHIIIVSFFYLKLYLLWK